jgi:hypothetical protein
MSQVCDLFHGPRLIPLLHILSSCLPVGVTNCNKKEIQGKVLAKAEALTGPITPPGKRVQTVNPPADEVNTMGFK